MCTSCDSKEQSNLEGSDGDKVADYIIMDINGYQVRVDTNADGNWIEPMQMAGDAVNYISISEASGYTVTVGKQVVDDGKTIEVEINGPLKKSEGIPVEITNNETGGTTTQWIRTLNEGFPVFETVNNGAKEGVYYFEPTMDWICKMNTNSEILFYKYNEKNMNDFKQVQDDAGNIYYCYNTPYASSDIVLTVSSSFFTPSKEVILDENYRVVKEIYGYTQVDGTDSKWGLDCHDFYFFSLDHYITLSYVPKWVDNVPADLIKNNNSSVRVMATVIQEIKDGEVVFEWDSTDYPILYSMSVEGNDYSMKSGTFCDYIHTNSITVCPNDDNIVISMRHNDSVMEISRKTGEIQWILGGKEDMFGLSNEQKSCRQHYARFTDEGTLTIFDNSTGYEVTSSMDGKFEGNGTGYARTIEYVLDEENKKLVSCEVFEPNMRLGDIMGSAQKTGGIHFVSAQ